MFVLAAVLKQNLMRPTSFWWTPATRCGVRDVLVSPVTLDNASSGKLHWELGIPKRQPFFTWRSPLKGPWHPQSLPRLSFAFCFALFDFVPRFRCCVANCLLYQVLVINVWDHDAVKVTYFIHFESCLPKLDSTFLKLYIGLRMSVWCEVPSWSHARSHLLCYIG
jgi:hypothetical protein